MIEIPPLFKGREPAHPDPKERNYYRNAEGLAEDIKYYGTWMRERAFERIAHLYPKVDLPEEYGGGKATVIAWIWARTVPSPDPAFSDVQVPIASSFLLSSKAGKEAWIEPVVDKAAKRIRYCIRKGGTKDEIAAAKAGTKAGRGVFRCLLSGSVITANYVKANGKSGAMSQKLIAIVAEGKRGRIYLASNEEHAAAAVSPWASKVADECRNTFLSGSTPAKLTGGTCHGYGLDQWGKLFTDRQLVALSTFSDLVREACSKIESDALGGGFSDDETPLRDGGTGAKAYAEAVSVYLSLGVSRLSDIQNSLCRWESSKTQVRNLFGRQAIPMLWDFGENNLFGNAASDYQTSLGSIIKVIERFCPHKQGFESSHDAQTAKFPAHSVISSDPPYYDNIVYADLSDFFFCWMKPTLQSVYPDLFGVLATPKQEELVASPYRHGSKKAAESFFLNGMSEAIANMARQSSNQYPATIYYAFKQSEIASEGISSTGWATFLQAVIDAGYAVVGTWPMRTELANRMIASGTNVAQRQRIHPLRHQRTHRVLHAARVAVIPKTPRQSSHQAQANVRLAKQRPAGVRSDASAVEPGDDLAPSEGMKVKPSWCTLCLHGTSLSDGCKLLIQLTLSDIRRSHAICR